MKNLMKTASAQNFAGFIRKFESMETDIPQVDISRDLQELGKNVEQQKTEVQPLPKKLVDFAINFVKTQGTNDGRAIRFEFDYEGGKSKASYITNNPKFKGDYLGIRVGNDFYYCDLNGKALIPKGLKNTREGGYSEEYNRKAQEVVNGVLTTLANYY